MTISTPSKITTPFAKNGAKNSIPDSSQIGITDGLASFTDGFPPLTMTPVSTGGVAPFGQDMNGILFKLSEAVQFQQAGGSFIYDAGFAAAVGGYPIGAIIQASDNSGFWINQTNNNSTSPEAFGAGWLPLEQQGESTVALTSGNVTLTALKAAKNVIILTGTITANLSVIFPTWAKNYTIINVTSGSFTITAKTASGSGFALSSGANAACCDGVSILGISSGGGGGGLTSGDVNSLIAAYLTGANSYTTGNRFIKFTPSGLMVQWGAIGGLPNIMTSGGTASFPQPFVGSPFIFLSAFNYYTTAGDPNIENAPYVYSNDNAGFNWQVQAIGDNIPGGQHLASFNYIAIGI